jgi:hypothetical protein
MGEDRVRRPIPVTPRLDPPVGRELPPRVRTVMARPLRVDPELKAPAWATRLPIPSNPSDAFGPEQAHAAFLAALPSVARLRGDLVGLRPIDPGPFALGLRQRILDRDGWRCAFCGSQADQVDHVIPRKHPRYQSASDTCNAVAICDVCNRDKADRTPAEWHGVLWAERWWRGWGPVLTGA